jgi:LTXXQ motif family protein
MRQGRFFLTGVLAISLVFPTTLDARPRGFGIFGALVGGLTGFGHHYHHRHHHWIARRHEAAPPQTVETEPQPTEEEPHAKSRRHTIAERHDRIPPQDATDQQPVEQSQGMQAPLPPANLSSLPAADFASIDDDFFGYVFAPSSYDTKLWAHGERDMIQAVFIKGSTSPPPNCDEQGAERATPLIQHVEQATRPNEEQHAALQELQAALAKAFDEIRATCRDVAPITPTARLKAMQERLFAIRDAGLSIRTSLSKFYDLLTNEQRAPFDAGDATASTDEKQGGGAQAAAQVCTAQVQAAYAWPAALIGRRVRPNQQQRASLEALQKTLFGMAMYLKGACPNEAHSTPVARLDAAMHRLDGMLYAVIAISPALEDFYGQLSDEQKARFNSINRAST